MNVASIPDIKQKNAVISSYLEVNCKQMDRAAGAQYPSLDIPVFSTLAFCKKHLPQKTPSTSALLNLIKCMSTALHFIFSVQNFRLKG